MRLGAGKMRWWKLSWVGMMLMTSCAHIQSQESRENKVFSPKPKNLTEVLKQDSNPSQNFANKVTFENGELIVQGKRLKNTHFDIPITINSRVEYWINYFCGKGRRHFEKYLLRSKFFIPYIVPLLRQNGLPEDLVYLSMIESGFNNLARSHAKAVGPWQFISATGKRYGLMVNWWVDERRDIRKSTLAAVEYLRDLYLIFKSWELAAAAYNAGEAKVARAIRRFGSKDFWVLSQHRFFRPETRDYVPKIIAAAIISKNREQFGFPKEEISPASDEAVAGDGEVVKVIKTDKPLGDQEYRDEKDLDTQNDPELASIMDDAEKEDRSSSTQLAEVTSVNLNLPSETQLKVGQNPILEMKPGPLAKPVPTPHISKNGEVGGEELAEFEVQSPADLLKVARASGLSYHTVKSLNPEILRWCTPPSVGTYHLKLPASTKERFLQTYNHQAFPRKVQFMTYKVHRGETLMRIARHFGIKVDPIADLNGLSPRAYLPKGLRVILPIPNDRSRTLSSLEVRDPPERRRHRYRRYRVRSHHRAKAGYKNRASARNSALQKIIKEVEG